MDKQELIKLLEIANQRIRHHHDALWKEETHYTWLVYILAAGVIFIAAGSGFSWILKPVIIAILGIIGIVICWLGYLVVRKEGQFFHVALQIRNRLNYAVGLSQSVKIEPDFNERLIPDEDIEIKSWEKINCEANKPLKCLLKGIFKPSSMGIRDWFQITLLLPILLFITMIIISIIMAV